MSWLSNSIKNLYKGNKNNPEEIVTLTGQHITIYHEKQVKELCALHALNNLLQENFYSKAILDKICIEYDQFCY